MTHIVFFLHGLNVANAESANINPQKGKVNTVVTFSTSLLTITEIPALDSATGSR